MGSFECRLGDCVLLKADGPNEAWVGIIYDFLDEDGDEGEKAANFMWFSTEKEIRNKEKKRTDFEPVSYELCLFGATVTDVYSLRLERTLYITVVGYQSACFHQWQGESHVASCLPQKLSEW